MRLYSFDNDKVAILIFSNNVGAVSTAGEVVDGDVEVIGEGDKLIVIGFCFTRSIALNGARFKAKVVRKLRISDVFSLFQMLETLAKNVHKKYLKKLLTMQLNYTTRNMKARGDD